MKRLYFIEPIVAIYAFASFMVYPLVQQYVYRRLWLEITNSSYPVSDNTSQCAANNTSHSRQQVEVQKAASLFSMYSDLSSMIPSLIVTLLLVAYSDQRGRKITIIMPLIGSLIYTLSFLAVSFFELNLYILIAASFVSALFGGIGTMLGGCFSYVADLCEDSKQKTLRMAVVDMMIGLLAGVASISTGYFLYAVGFNWPFFTSAIFQAVNLIYAVFILEETRVIDRSETAACCRAMQKLASSICNLFVGGSSQRKWVLVLLIVTFSSLSFVNTGGLSMITLYELNEPLCWSEILVGYGAAASTSIFITSFVGVYLFSRCLPNIAIAFIGMLSVGISMFMTAFAKTTLMMFLVRIPAMFAIMPFPVLRSMMSKVVSKSEQGALFACVAFTENLSTYGSSAVFSRIYAATVAWCPGFIFLLGSGLCIIPISLLGIFRCFHSLDSNDNQALLSEDGTEASDDPPVA
ncbi:solute carrier family 46 member 3-like [Sinocyclocheilus rhinocerous]|uniref:solute carrier family 46 member 3-like n=1 Tax=Sinocyclocheilus rhinocerous TaxID=307959 RepID=UPI0007BA9831|nr:PREDICTED: solute carrier family 46 member 3-like [Sinocyclocheilus rhinocerous]XP_016381452.1 PREDICTED: solute carrier family 46 member 3-like [Sinocyclocheilus rhinocerous]